MKRCWLHIGMPKTGSTSIQVYLDKQTKGKGWKYISLGGAASTNREMHAMFGTRPEKWYWFVKRGESKEQIARRGEMLRQRLAKTIRATDATDIILSAEVISLFERGAVEALHRFLSPLFDEIRVVAYVRPPVGFMVSYFQQRVKGGVGEFDITQTRPRYRRRFRHYDGIFGREHVIFRKFDPASFPNRCIVADFCELIGIDPPLPGAVSRVNESLTREACGILFAYRKFGGGYGVGDSVIRENNMIIAALLRMQGRKFSVSESVAAAGLDRADIHWMEKRLGASLAERVADDGAEVTSEEDLLAIQRSSIEDFVARFVEAHGIRVSVDRIPAGDPVDPREVAVFIEHCRELCRELIARKESGLVFKLVHGSRRAQGDDGRAASFRGACRRWLSKFRSRPAAGDGK